MYLKNFVSSTHTILDAAAFVAPLVFSVYMALGLIWSASKMGKPLLVLEEHIKQKMPSNAEKLKFWDFMDVVIAPLL